MKQILQDVSRGELSVAEVPAPLATSGEVLIANRASLLSAETEKMAIDLAKKSLLGKARERPDHVRRVLQKVRNEGLLDTIRQVREKLDEPMAMGYSSAGTVLACGDGVQHFKPGDRVASNGPHAEIVAAPKNLVARIPDSVSFQHASFTVLGSIALQGVRLSTISLGDRVLVIGLGLVGQLTVALLNAAGCVVFGVDLDTAKNELAKEMGAAIASPTLDAESILDLTKGVGADAVIITASTTSNGPIELAANAVRRRGRVVLVGVVGLELDRRPFYFKEAEFVVSCSYGPGRYDPEYEQRGHDYPIGYVRWTEQRNMQAVLDLMAAGKLDVAPLISHRFPIGQAEDAYQLIQQGDEPYLGVLLEYDGQEGSEVRGVRCEVRREEVLEYGFEVAAGDENEIFDHPDIDVVFSITQHNLHARHVMRAIKTGKHCFVEKPLCLTIEELQDIEAARERAGDSCPVLMVGFNRRFSPGASAVREAFSDVQSPLTVSFRFNAGSIEADHWVQHIEEGGGRIIGEACHAIDFATFLTGSPPVRVFAESIGGANAPEVTDDQCFVTLRHANGSVSNIAYLAGGDRACPKERIEVFGGERTAIIDDFRRVTVYRGGRKKTARIRSGKGHGDEVRAFLASIRDGSRLPMAWHDIRSVSLASILAVRSLREGVPFEVPGDR